MFATRTIELMIIALVALFSVHSYGQEDQSIPSPQTIQELKSAIEEVMKEEQIPAAGIAMVNEDGPVWVESLGKACIENNIDADDHTMFRIGSTTKMFTSLAVLKLQEEGLISLDDKVRDLVPEIEFTNRWEETNPVLVAHLLEHTTGWDDFHVIEYAHNDSTPISLKDGLDFHPQSRVSRWMPGTRMAYCNSGPGVAAYIVEKLSGKKFEDFIQETFFNPMGMTSATYFKNDNFEKHGITQYHVMKPQAYWHILQRPSGSINATPTDMSQFLQFYMNRGNVDGIQLISEKSLKRMETCMTTIGAKAGLEEGYGLSNYTTPYKSFIYQGHEGSVGPAFSGYGYIPEQHIGFSVLVNSSNRAGFMRIIDLVCEFQTSQLPIEKTETSPVSVKFEKDISGYYVPINSRSENLHYLMRILLLKHIWQSDDIVNSTGLLGGEVKKHIQVSETQYISAETGKTNMAQTVDPLDGDVVALFDVNMASEQILKPISTVSLYSQLTVLALWICFMLVSVAYGFVWSIRYWLGKIEGGASIRVRLWPLIASLLFLGAVAINVIVGAGGMSSFTKHFGRPGFVSISFMLLTIGFALASAWSLVCVIKERKTVMNKMVYWYSSILAILHVLITFYLFWFGVIGMRLWT